MQLYDLPIVWMPWAEAGLGVMLLVICALQPRTLHSCIQTLSSPIQRRYNTGVRQPLVRVLRIVYEWGILALSMLVVLHAWHHSALIITGAQVVRALGALIGIAVVKRMMNGWIQFTFRYRIQASTYHTCHNDLWMVVSTVLWVVLLLSPWLSHTALWLVPCIVAGVYLAILWWKLMQVLGWTMEHIVWTIVYMLHVEVLPWGVGFLLVES